MITYEQLVDCMDTVVDSWGEKGKEVVVACLHENPFNDNMNKFLDNCIACGGNWGGMILTGIRKLYPKIYDLIPDDMGVFAFGCLCSVLVLLGVDTKADK